MIPSKSIQSPPIGTPVASKIRMAELAKALSICPRSVYALRGKGVIPFYKVGGIYLYDLAEVNKALERYRVAAVGE